MQKKNTGKAGPEGEFIFAARIPVPQGQFPLSKLITTSFVGWVGHNFLSPTEGDQGCAASTLMLQTEAALG